MKPTNRIATRILAGGFAFSCFILSMVHAQEPDLPFDSGSTGADGDLVFLPPSGAEGRHLFASAYWADTQSAVFIGGILPSASSGTTQRITWDGIDVTRDSVTGIGSMMQGAMTYDSNRNRLVYFGGVISGQYHYDYTYEFDGTSWTRVNTSGAGARNQAVLVFDSVRNESVLFGGRNSSNAYLDSTWVWDGSTWTNRNPATAPAARRLSAAAFDSENGELVLFGGYNGASLGDTWVWDGTTWSEQAPTTSPSPRHGHKLVYDSTRKEVVMFGGNSEIDGYSDETWVWKSGEWTKASVETSPYSRNYHEMVYDPNRQRTVLFAGSGEGGVYLDDLWEWDGTNWLKIRELSNVVFDMTGRPDGTYHYNRIEIPAGMTMTFKKNANNAPVTWLAQEDVVIDGIVDLNGEDGHGTPDSVNVAQAGPGGFGGGLGGWDWNTSGSYAGTHGFGPGGGAPGLTQGAQGEDGRYSDLYGNAYVQPLIGGSGGGGAGSSDTVSGQNGGAGGGAILIASSRDIIVNGQIRANGGTGVRYWHSDWKYSGSGSGGAIRIACDVLRGSGALNANGGADGGGTGRIRVEAFNRPFYSSGGSASPSASVSVPLENFSAATDLRSELIITNVAGAGIAQPPTGNLATPDVIFQETGPVSILVTASNIPDGTAIQCRVTSNGSIINLPLEGDPEVTLSGGSATFSTIVPAGRGAIQAFTIYTNEP